MTVNSPSTRGLSRVASVVLPLTFFSCSEQPYLVFGQIEHNQKYSSTELLERGRELELDTPYILPPGDPEAHFAVGFARVLCSAVFVSGLEEEFAAHFIDYFTSPLEKRASIYQRDMDKDN